MSVDDTKPHVNESAFKEPISADLPRRQLDRKILESYDSNQERIRNISSRMMRIETIFDSLNKDLRRLEETHKDMAQHIEATAHTLSTIGNKLAVHAEMEEYQWTLVNQAHETLAQIGVALNQHLQHSEGLIARVRGAERLIWALWGVIGASALALIPLALKGMGG
ncbi:MAG TPA: hypothetical protein PLC99_22480 [Verrucomicrobiota bacterium]|nr:hypothetical protein [Verrucomicrobiota bacterium]